MLSASDVRAFLQQLQRDFRLIVDGISYLCNRQNLCAFSSVVRSAISNNPALSEFAVSPNIPISIVEEVISFLHGGDFFHPKDSSLFDYFYFGACLGIDIISKRLTTDVFRCLTDENVADRFRALAPFPAFCGPIVLFLDANQSTFERFVHFGIFHADFVRSLVTCTATLFEREDDKFDFILRYSSASAEPDLSLYETIRTEGLAEDTLNVVLDDPEICRHCRTFPVLANLIREGREISAMRSELESGISTVRIRRERLEERAHEIRHIRDSTLTLSATIEAESQVHKRALALADQLDIVAACVSVLAAPDPRAAQFLEHVARLSTLTERMGEMLEDFRNGGGWLLYPKSTVTGANVKGTWTQVLKELTGLTSNFVLSRNTVFHQATSLAMIAEALRSPGRASRTS
jgi:hypothetical protein